MKRGLRNFFRSLYCYNSEAEGGSGGGGEGIPTATVTPGIDLEGSKDEGGEGTSTDFSTLIPEEYREKPYIQNILNSDQPQTEFFKQFDNAQKLIGQKTIGIPDENASDEDKKAFYQKLGVPEDVADYDIPSAEYTDEDKDLGDFMQKNRGSEEFMTDLRGLFKEAKLTKEQAKILAPGYEQLLVKHNRQDIENLKAATGQLDIDFYDKLKQDFGAQTDKILEIGQKTLTASLPDELRKDMQGWTNDELHKVATVLYHVNKKFISEDGFDGADTFTTSKQDLRDKARKMMASDAFQDPMHPENEQVRKQVNEMYRQIG